MRGPARSRRSGRSSMVLALLGLAVLSGCADDIGPGGDPLSRDSDIVERGAPPLTAAEVRAYLRDTTLSFEGEERVWHAYLREDGSMTGISIGKKDRSSERANGTWEVRPDGLFCRRWDNDWSRGATGCAEVYRYGREYLFVHKSGGQGEQTEYRRTRAPGNTQGL